MDEYHKIKTVYLRDPATQFRTLREGEWATPEFAYLAQNEWVFTEKVDGTNIRVMFNGHSTIRFGGRTDNAVIPAPLLSRLQERFLPQQDVLRINFPKGVCLYGEGYGAKIQKVGGNYRPDQDFVLFDVKIGDWWLQRPNVEGIAKMLDIAVVPVIGVGSLHDMVRLATVGFNSRWGDFAAEGIVARPSSEILARDGSRIITKVKLTDFAK